MSYEEEYEDDDIIDNDDELSSTDLELVDDLTSFYDEDEEKPEITKPEPEQTKLPDTTAPDFDENTLVKVKVNGEEREVPFSELKNGYMRQADYSNKTAEVAQQRTEVQRQQEKYTQYLQSIPLLAETALQNIDVAKAELFSDELAELSRTDATAFVQRKAFLEKSIYDYQNVYNEMSEKYNQFQQEQSTLQNQQRLDFWASENQSLVKDMPEWKDENYRNSVMDYAKSKLGLDDATIANLYSKQFINTVDKARKYDEMTSSNNLSKKRVEKTPPRTITSSGEARELSSDDNRKRGNVALKKANSGKDQDLVDYLAGLL